MKEWIVHDTEGNGHLFFYFIGEQLFVEMNSGGDLNVKEGLLELCNSSETVSGVDVSNFFDVKLQLNIGELLETLESIGEYLRKYKKK